MPSTPGFDQSQILHRSISNATDIKKIHRVWRCITKAIGADSALQQQYGNVCPLAVLSSPFLCTYLEIQCTRPNSFFLETNYFHIMRKHSDHNVIAKVKESRLLSPYLRKSDWLLLHRLSLCPYATHFAFLPYSIDDNQRIAGCLTLMETEKIRSSTD